MHNETDAALLVVDFINAANVDVVVVSEYTWSISAVQVYTEYESPDVRGLTSLN